MAVAHLVVLNSEGKVALAGGDLPTVATTELFTAGDVLGVRVAVVRTLARLGDDRVVLMECVDAPADATGVHWEHPERAATMVPFGDAIAAAAHRGDVGRPVWMERGWLADSLDWVTGVVGPVEGFRQIKHWGLSAVVRATAGSFDVVLKQVPPALAAEGPVTALLGQIAPGLVARVLAVDGDRFLMETFVIEDRPVEPAGLAALAVIQQRAAAAVAALSAAGCRSQNTLAADIEALLNRDDLLFERDWDLSSTDTRRPTRRLEAADVAQLRALLERVASDARKLQQSAPITIVHGDFHPNNVAAVGGRHLILDWGTAFLGDPRVDVWTWQQSAATDAGVHEFLAAWNISLAEWSDVAYTAYLTDALTYATLADAMLDDAARKDWSAAVQKRLIEALDLVKK